MKAMDNKTKYLWIINTLMQMGFQQQDIERIMFESYIPLESVEEILDYLVLEQGQMYH